MDDDQGNRSGSDQPPAPDRHDALGSRKDIRQALLIESRFIRDAELTGTLFEVANRLADGEPRPTRARKTYWPYRVLAAMRLRLPPRAPAASPPVAAPDDVSGCDLDRALRLAEAANVASPRVSVRARLRRTGQATLTRDLADVADFWRLAKLRYETEKAAVSRNGSTAWPDLKGRDLALRNLLDVTDKIFPSELDERLALIARIYDALGIKPSRP